MTYRSDQDAQDEQTRARIVRIRGELHALEAQIGAPPSTGPARWRWAVGGALLGAGLTSLIFGAMFAVPQLALRRGPEGAPAAARAQPDRRELDGELLRLHAEMQGCAPRGFSGRVQADVSFEGATGAIYDIAVVNEGDTTLEQGMITCVEQTFQRLGTPRFRAASYLYRNTLVWTRGTLVAGLVEPSPEQMSGLDGLGTDE
jgi:hypothetical protein